jgi:hypothetical protein
MFPAVPGRQVAGRDKERCSREQLGPRRGCCLRAPVSGIMGAPPLPKILWASRATGFRSWTRPGGAPTGDLVGVAGA